MQGVMFNTRQLILSIFLQAQGVHDSVLNIYPQQGEKKAHTWSLIALSAAVAGRVLNGRFWYSIGASRGSGCSHLYLFDRIKVVVGTVPSNSRLPVYLQI